MASEFLTAKKNSAGKHFSPSRQRGKRSVSMQLGEARNMSSKPRGTRTSNDQRRLHNGNAFETK